VGTAAAGPGSVPLAYFFDAQFVEGIEPEVRGFVSQLKEDIETSLSGARGQHLGTLRECTRGTEVG
jgi:hypothetical protein